MDANLENNEQLRNSGTKSSRVGRKRGRNLAVITLLFILIAVGVALAYFLFWQYEEETERCLCCRSSGANYPSGHRYGKESDV